MRTVTLVFLSLVLATAASAENVVLVNGTVIDGTLGARRQGNIRIRDGKVTDIGAFKPAADEAVMDVKGLIVAPGFIDLQNHSAEALEKDLGTSSQITQGITTAVLGADGRGPYAVEEFMSSFDEKQPALNIMTFVGHGTVRRQIMGADYKRPATEAEIQLMSELVENAMREGAFGLSSALEYDPGFYSTTAELIALAKVVARYGGTYMMHLRNEGDKIIDAIKEAILVGQAAKIPVQISNIKLRTVNVSGKAAQVLAELDKARAQGVDIAATMYPYNTWSGPITALLSGSDFDESAAAKALTDVGGPSAVRVVRQAGHPEYGLKTLEEIAGGRQVSAVDLYREIVKDGGAEIVCSSINESDIRTFLQHPWVMIASDGGINTSHPRSSGTFPRVLAKYVREEKVLTLERAIRKMTGLPASRIGLKERGVLRKGSPADVVVFDPLQIRDTSTLEGAAFFAPSVGMKYVFVNGTLVVRDGQPTDARPGLALR